MVTTRAVTVLVGSLLVAGMTMATIKSVSARCETDANGVEYEYAGGGGCGGSSDDGDDPAERRQEDRESAAERQASNLNEQGRTAYANKDWAAAANYFNQALQIEPGDDTFQGNLAMALNNEGTDAQAQGDWQTAISYYRSAVSYDATPLHRQNLQTALDTVQAIALNTSGRNAYQAGNYAQAADLFRQALQLWPTADTYRANVGLALDMMAWHTSNHLAAIDLYKMALQYNPDLQDAKTNLQSHLAAQQQIEEAAKVQAAAAQSVAALATVIKQPAGGQQAGLDFVDPNETLRDAPADKPNQQAGGNCGGGGGDYAANGTCSGNSSGDLLGTTKADPSKGGDLRPDNRPNSNSADPGDTHPIPQATNLVVTTPNNPQLGFDTPAVKVTQPVVNTAKPTLAATPPYTPEQQAKLDADPDLKTFRKQQSDAETLQKKHEANVAQLQQEYDHETDKAIKADLGLAIVSERSAADIAGGTAAAAKANADTQVKKVLYGGAPILLGTPPKTDLGIKVPSPTP